MVPAISLRDPPKKGQNEMVKNSLNQPLVYPHLKGIPGLTTLTTGCLTGGDLQTLRREADWALDAEILRLGTLNELLADLLKRLNFAGGQGDSDFVDFLRNVSIDTLVAMISRKEHTGPSPKSFSGFWYDISAVRKKCGLGLTFKLA
jgi:hypothetical protein